MQADERIVAYIASTYYNLQPVLGSIKQLAGYDAKNFLLTDSASNKTYVLKIVNREESVKELTGECAAKAEPCRCYPDSYPELAH
jgi:Ser/Thr protein kinase RdoA (MazF antagonist)